MDSLEAVKCPIVSLQVQAEKGYFWIMLGKRGCESELSLELNEAKYNGKTNDLTAFGTNVYEWQQIDVITENKKVRLERNGKTLFSGSYTEAMGPIMEISFFFNGIGMIDDVELKNTEGQRKFFDDFEAI